ncbi:unnamed protein product, partial [Porites evermanni]
ANEYCPIKKRVTCSPRPTDECVLDKDCQPVAGKPTPLCCYNGCHYYCFTDYIAPTFPPKKGEPGAVGPNGDIVSITYSNFPCWNQGTSGILGLRGEIGDPGPPGEPGPSGGAGGLTSGEKGPDPQAVGGIKGEQGAPGAKGPPGSPGRRGPPGTPGTRGGTGPTGEAGPTGRNGQQGPPGLPGEDGSDVRS